MSCKHAHWQGQILGSQRQCVKRIISNIYPSIVDVPQQNYAFSGGQIYNKRTVAMG